VVCLAYNDDDDDDYDDDNNVCVNFFAASIAVLVRQTNIVWVAFIAFLSTSHVLKLHVLQYNGRLSPNVLRSSKYLQVST